MVILPARNIYATSSVTLFRGNDPSKSPVFAIWQVDWLSFSRAIRGFLGPYVISFQSTSSTCCISITTKYLLCCPCNVTRTCPFLGWHPQRSCRSRCSVDCILVCIYRILLRSTRGRWVVHICYLDVDVGPRMRHGILDGFVYCFCLFQSPWFHSLVGF